MCPSLLTSQGEGSTRPAPMGQLRKDPGTGVALAWDSDCLAPGLVIIEGSTADGEKDAAG